MFKRSFFFILILAVLVLPPARASAETLDLIILHTPVLYHWPAADAYIGTADDAVNATPLPTNQSETNSLASFSYNAFDFGGGSSDLEYLPEGMNAVTFLSGSVDVNVAALNSGGGAILNGWNISGTEPYIGHGDYASVITAVNSGSYDPVSGNVTLNVDFEAVLPAGSTNATGFDFYGTAFYRDADDFDDLTGYTYFDTVLIPLAQSLSAGSLFFIIGNGIVPESTGGTGGYFPSMPVTSVLVAVGPGSSPNENSTWGQVKALYAD